MKPKLLVAPYAGAWIETPVSYNAIIRATSLLTRERGLKRQWQLLYWPVICRSLRGSVD